MAAERQPGPGVKQTKVPFQCGPVPLLSGPVGSAAWIGRASPHREEIPMPACLPACLPARLPARTHCTDLLLCRHHYRVSKTAIVAAGAVVLDPEITPAGTRPAFLETQPSSSGH